MSAERDRVSIGRGEQNFVGPSRVEGDLGDLQLHSDINIISRADRRQW